MKPFKWELGRQNNSGYRKLLLLTSKLFKFDVYLLHFPTNSEIMPHKDLVDSGNHFRLNLILHHARIGGRFECEKYIINTPRIKLFRPDLYEHSVKRILDGNRYVFSIGWIRN